MNEVLLVLEKRFLAAFIALIVCMLVCIPGWNYFYNERRRIGSALIGLGAAIGFGGVLLLWLSIFPWSWGWWL